MSQLMPLFATAPRLKLYITNQVVAYGVGFNVSISTDVQPIFVIGQYAPVALEPTMYNVVTGTFQIVRLSKTNRVPGVNSSLTSAPGRQLISQTGALSAGGELKSTVGDGVTNSPLAQSELFKHLNPAQLLLSKAFDVRIYMKVPKLDGTGIEEVEWFDIQSCRITSRNTNISMGQIVNEPLSFQGLLASPKAAPGSDIEEFSLDGLNESISPSK